MKDIEILKQGVKAWNAHALEKRNENPEWMANLKWASLYGANLEGANGIAIFGPMPTSGRMIYAVHHEGCCMVQAGCFWGSAAALRAAVTADHNDPTYLAVCHLIDEWRFIC